MIAAYTVGNRSRVTPLIALKPLIISDKKSVFDDADKLLEKQKRNMRKSGGEREKREFRFLNSEMERYLFIGEDIYIYILRFLNFY